MEEIRQVVESHPRLKKTNTVRLPLDPLECWNLNRKENARQYSSVAKVRSRLASNEITPPIGDDKTILKIQKKLDALTSIQSTSRNSFKTERIESSPVRQVSARRIRKGVIYRPSEQLKSNVIEIYANGTCANCQTVWLGSTTKSNCSLCKTPKAKFGLEIELKLIEDGRASLIIGNKETAISLNTKSKSTFAIYLEEKNNTFDFTKEWSEYTRVATPSFHLNTEPDTSFTTNISFPADMSFSEHCKVANDLMEELENLIKKQGKVLESPSMGKIQEVCQGVGMDYGRIAKKVAGSVGGELGTIVDKAFKGFLMFFDSCILSLVRYIGQLRSANQQAKEDEAKYKSKIAALSKQCFRN